MSIFAVEIVPNKQLNILFMYRVNLHKVSNPDQNCFLKNLRSEFYLSSSDEVCILISKLPKKWFVSLLEFDLDTPDSIFKEFDFDCV